MVCIPFVMVVLFVFDSLMGGWWFVVALRRVKFCIGGGCSGLGIGDEVMM